jgi:hypothetical protein
MSGYPESLPGRLYLLAYDPRKERLTARTQLGYPMRAAALTEVRLRGHIADEGRKVRVTNPGGVADPVLGAVLREVADSRPPVLDRLGATGRPAHPAGRPRPARHRRLDPGRAASRARHLSISDASPS